MFGDAMTLHLSSPANAGDPVIPAVTQGHDREAAAYWMARFRGP
jgi:hypothetical protein